MMLMTKKMILYTLFFLVVAGKADHLGNEDFDSFENIFEFTDGLKNESDNILDYIARVQALFCPEQPICTADGERNSTEVLETLPEIIGIGADVTQMEDFHKIAGVCCLPCSCNPETCQEDGNCCMSKIALEAGVNNTVIDYQNALGQSGIFDGDSEAVTGTRVYSECIKASWLSYRDKDDWELATDLDIPAYSMITQCFGDNASRGDVLRCQTPSKLDESEVMVPVISSDTGRIYWNPNCARCNDDDGDIIPWTAAVHFKIGIAYFANNTRRDQPAYPDTYSRILKFISQTGNIVYIPPVPLHDKLCLRKINLKTCTDSLNNPTGSWLRRACERFYNPVIIEGSYGRRVPFLNIFCYLCRQQYILPTANRQCGYQNDNTKDVSDGMLALLDYSGTASHSNDMTAAPRLGKCRCDEVYDHYIHVCRRIYCPAGDFMVNCHCVQPLKMIFGMPVLLTIKLKPTHGYWVETPTANQITRYHNTLKEILLKISESIRVEFIGLLECVADAGEYFLSLALVRSLPGYDTKETMKPFLDYLDESRRNITMVVKQTTYSVRLTSRVRLWANRTDNQMHLDDLETPVQSKMTLFESYRYYEAYLQLFQVLSPLLYCRQVQLNNTEVEEKGGQLTTLRTHRKITLSYYHRTPLSTFQVCADHYIKGNDKSIGTAVGPEMLFLLVIVSGGFSGV